LHAGFVRERAFCCRVCMRIKRRKPLKGFMCVCSCLLKGQIVSMQMGYRGVSARPKSIGRVLACVGFSPRL
jgi:hypothetical protein